MSLDIEALYAQKHERLFLYFCKRLGGHDPADAEDLAAATFLRAWENRDRYRPLPGVPPSVWLFQIAKNLLIDYYRRYGGKVTMVPLDDWKLYVDHTGTSAHVEKIDAERAATRLLDGLTDIQRAVIVAHTIDGRQIPHIAEEMGRTVESTKKLQFRALAALRRRMVAA